MASLGPSLARARDAPFVLARTSLRFIPVIIQVTFLTGSFEMIKAKANYTLNVINKTPNDCKAAPPCLLRLSTGASLSDPTAGRHPKVAIPLEFSSLVTPIGGLGCEHPSPKVSWRGETSPWVLIPPSSIRKSCRSIQREIFQGIHLHWVHSTVHYGLHGAEVFQSLHFAALGLPKDSKNQ